MYKPENLDEEDYDAMSPGTRAAAERALRRETTRKLLPLDAHSLGSCMRRARMMSYDHHWHSDAGQREGLPKKGWSLRRCVLGEGGDSESHIHKYLILVSWYGIEITTDHTGTKWVVVVLKVQYKIYTKMTPSHPTPSPPHLKSSVFLAKNLEFCY